MQWLSCHWILFESLLNQNVHVCISQVPFQSKLRTYSHVCNDLWVLVHHSLIISSFLCLRVLSSLTLVISPTSTKKSLLRAVCLPHLLPHPLHLGFFPSLSLPYRKAFIRSLPDCDFLSPLTTSALCSTRNKKIKHDTMNTLSSLLSLRSRASITRFVQFLSRSIPCTSAQR